MFWRKKPAIVLVVKHPDFTDKRTAVRFAKRWRKGFNLMFRAGGGNELSIKPSYDKELRAARIAIQYVDGARLLALDVARKSASNIEVSSREKLDVPYSVEIEEVS